MKAIGIAMAMTLVACGGGDASKEEATLAFGAVTAGVTIALSEAIAGSAGATAETITLNYSGACTLGGTAGITGTFDTSGTDFWTAFEINAEFNQCKEADGTLDGDLRWKSTVNGETLTATITGDIDWTHQDGSASCDFDLTVSVTLDGAESYSGSACGYSAQELELDEF